MATPSKRTTPKKKQADADDSADLEERTGMTELVLPKDDDDPMAMLYNDAERRFDSFYRACKPADADRLNTRQAILAGAKDDLRKKPADVECQLAVETAKESLKTLTKEIDVFEFRFGSIGADATEELEEKHHPKTKQIAQAEREGKGRPNWDPDTFRSARIAATMIWVRKNKDPKKRALTPDEVASLWKRAAWNQADRNQLLLVAHNIDHDSNAVTLTSVGKD